MRKNSRAQKLYDAAMDDLGACGITPAEAQLVRCMAIMIAKATEKASPKEKAKLLYNEQDVLKVLNYDLSVTRWGGLNAQLRRMTLQADDLEKFSAWFTGSMYPWMRSKDIELTFSMLTRKYPEWLERARQYSGSGHDNSIPEESSWR